MIQTKDLYLEMQEQIAQRVTDYENGNINVLDALTDLRGTRSQLEEGLSLIKQFESQYTQEIESQAKEYGGQYNGFEIEVRQGRKMYDFSKVEEVKIAKDNLKELEDYYKKAFEAHQKNILMATDAGEEIQLPELKYSKPSVVVKKARV